MNSVLALVTPVPAMIAVTGGMHSPAVLIVCGVTAASPIAAAVTPWISECMEVVIC